jgi:hypothetical protein
MYVSGRKTEQQPNRFVVIENTRIYIPPRLFHIIKNMTDDLPIKGGSPAEVISLLLNLTPEEHAIFINGHYTEILDHELPNDITLSGNFLTTFNGLILDFEAVKAFTDLMLRKMFYSRLVKGRDGWETISEAMLLEHLQVHFVKGDMVDVANFAMMLGTVYPSQKEPQKV